MARRSLRRVSEPPGSRLPDRRAYPVAIVGIGCRLPGGADDPSTFWRLVHDGVDAITQIPADRWNVDAFFDPDPRTPGKSYARHGGFLADIAGFDAAFFGIAPREAGHMDPQQRLLLEVAWEAIEDAGLVVDRRQPTPAGVFVGIANFDYAKIQRSLADMDTVEAHTATGVSYSIAANRVSHALNLTGPSVAIDTACSSSLVAVHLACLSLMEGACEVALAGGVNALLNPETFVNFCRLAMLSPDGRCRTFDAGANGYVRGEGAGVVVLKPLARAIADGDRVRAVVLASGVNQDGRTPGITMPSRDAQEALLRRVFDEAGVDPSRVGYFEAHGTGTPVGDPIEAAAIGAVLSPGRPAGADCFLGSVKTNIGHLESAAGVAGLIKATLALEHRRIPPNLHFVQPSPDIDFERLRLRVPTTPVAWPADLDLVAAVSSFGFGGTNATVVLCAPEPQPVAARPAAAAAAPPPGRDAELFCLSAETAPALHEAARRVLARLRGAPSQPSLSAVCWTAARRRVHHRHRLAVAATGRDDLVSRLETFERGEASPGLAVAEARAAERPRLAFVYSGQGPQWWGMGRRLFEREPVFREMIERCDVLFRRLGPWSLVEELSATEATSRLDDTAIAQPAIFAVQVALTSLWRSWGIGPDATVGHSVGEVAAAWAAGALGLDDAAAVIFHRGRCMARASGRGGRMLAVGLSAEDAADALRGYDGRVVIGAFNSPLSVTLSGDGDALEEIARALAASHLFCRFLASPYAFHSHHMDGMADELVSSLAAVRPEAPRLPIYSTVSAERATEDTFAAGYWWDNVRQPVRFAAAAARLIEDGFTTFLEIGPHPVLAASISECLLDADARGVVLPSLNRRQPDHQALFGSLGVLHAIGADVAWEAVYPGREAVADLPRYPWEHEPHFVQTPECRDLLQGAVDHPLLGRRIAAPVPCWEKGLPDWRLGYLADHRLGDHAVLPATAYIEMGLAVGRLATDGARPALESLRLHKALFLPEGARVTLYTRYDAETFAFEVHSRVGRADWQLNASGTLAPCAETKAGAAVLDVAAADGHLAPLSPDDLYARFDASGLRYGPAFRGVADARASGREAIARVVAPAGVFAALADYALHPALLDACFQAIGCPAEADLKTAFLPVAIGRVSVGGRPGNQLWSHVRVDRIEGDRLHATLQVLDGDGVEVARIDGLECQAIESPSAGEPLSLASSLYAYSWWPKPVGRSSAPSRGCRVDPAELATSARRWLRRATVPSAPAGLDELLAIHLENALADLGWPLGTRPFTTERARTALGLDARSASLLEGTLRLMAGTGRAESTPGGWRLTRRPGRRPAGDLWRALVARAPGLAAELTLINRGGSMLPEVLRGGLPRSEALGPGDYVSLLQQVCEDGLPFRPVHLAVKRLLERIVSRRAIDRPLRMLEIIGARHGGSLVASFASAGDVECAIEPPGGNWAEAEPGSFDLVVTRSVLYANRDPEALLARAARVVADEGVLLAVEPARVPPWWRFVLGLAELTSGDAPGADEPAFGAPGAMAQAALERSGWNARLYACSPGGARGRHGAACGLTLADRPGGAAAARRPLVSVAAPTSPDEAGTWIVFADAGGWGRRLATLLEKRLARVILVVRGGSFRTLGPSLIEIDPASEGDVARALAASCGDAGAAAVRGIVHLWALDAFTGGENRQGPEARLHETSLGVVRLAQTLMARPDGETPRLWVVTAGAHAAAPTDGLVCPFQSALWGIGRTLANEFPQSRCTLVDLAPGATAGERDLEALATELVAPDGEDEIALRAGERLVHRLGRVPLAPAASRGRGRPTTGFRLDVGQKRDLDGLMLVQQPRGRPARGEVEVLVEAAGLNFSDVLKALGLYPGLGPGPVPLGLELSGIVGRVGRGVTSATAGDRVMALAPFSFADRVVVPEHRVAPIPRWLTFLEAATIPVAFLTAYYALVTRGGLRPRERVLVHSASGGVGLAAIQVARDLGAEVFATAGTPEKRAFLSAMGVGSVMDSRSLAFADEIMALTGGEGVDVVLNSLAGDAIAKGLSVLRDCGRFIEIGKRDIYDDRRIGLLPFRRNLSFSAVDLDRAMREQPEVVAAILRLVARGVAARRFAPLPFRAFPIGAAPGALRTMAKARHIGKIVVSVADDAPRVAAAPAVRPRFRPDATYLVTGGFGGLGLVVARWLADGGARHLALVGRHGPPTDEARAAVERLKASGVTVAEFRADVSKDRDVGRVFRAARRRMPPVRGVIHAAAVLDDALVANLDGERLDRVMAPKAYGAWHLHRHTAGLPLDFFVLFSSVSSVIGMPGQCSYVSANAFLDGLSAHRRALGLPSITINWGYVGEVGMAARNPDTVARFEHQGLEPIAPAEALDVLGWFLAEAPTQMAAVKMDWGRFGEVFRMFGRSPKFGPLFREGAGADGAGREAGAARARVLDDLPDADRPAAVRALVREQVARVLGTVAARLETETPLTDLGFDSLMAVELRNWLDSTLGVTLPAVEVMRGPSIEQLAETVLRFQARSGAATGVSERP